MTQRPTTKKPSPSFTTERGPVILVIDDDSSIRELIARALGAQYTVYEAVDGMAGAEILGAIPAPALILCDIMMPRVDGLTFARMLKANPKLANIPLIFLSAKDAPLDVIRGITAGARSYLTKPFAVKDLVEIVGKALGTKPK
jgi:CheY-like chemotaxis protein